MTNPISLFYDADTFSSAGFFVLTLCLLALTWSGCWLSHFLVGRLEQIWQARERALRPPSTLVAKRSHDVAHAVVCFFCTVGAYQLCRSWTHLLAIVSVCAVLLVLARIDAYTGLLPDVLTQPLLWAGLLFNLMYSVVPLEQSVLGVVAGYLPLWLVASIFQQLTGRPAMGNGDFKFAAAIGSWVGVSLVPAVLLVASCLACMACGVRWFKTGQGAAVALPFGPFLSFAGGLGIFTCFWPVS